MAGGLSSIVVMKQLPCDIHAVTVADDESGIDDWWLSKDVIP